jgi:RHS repeat-associated protein
MAEGSGYRETGEAGMLFYRARYYQPSIGRWSVCDPHRIGSGQISVYGYVFNDPLNYVDPSGKSGTLTLHASGKIDSLDVPGAGHAWIEYTPDGGVPTTYGTWGEHTAGPKNGLLEDVEAGRSFADGQAVMSTWINDDNERALMNLISSYRSRGDAGWSRENNCSRFAHDAWLTATGQDLDARHPWLRSFSWPTGLRDSILKANGGQRYGIRPIVDHRIIGKQVVAP